MSNAARFYSSLIQLYPESFRREFGAQMLQTFYDWHEDIALVHGRVGLSSWISLISDEVRNIVGERFATLSMDDQQKPIGLLLALATLFVLLTVSVTPRASRDNSAMTNATQPATLDSRALVR